MNQIMKCLLIIKHVLGVISISRDTVKGWVITSVTNSVLCAVVREGQSL